MEKKYSPLIFIGMNSNFCVHLSLDLIQTIEK